MQEIKDGKLSLVGNLKYDLPAGLVVFLVALPLCLGISLASGAAPITGVLAGVIGGIVVGALSGSSLGVSGPAAGLAAIVQGYISNEAVSYETFLLVVILSGVFQVLLGYLKAGVIADYFPSNVIKGMLAAIGILLILKQIPHGLGDDKDAEGEMEFSQADGKNTFTEIWDALMDPHMGAVLITLVSIAILVLWQSNAIKKNKILSMIPAPLLVVVTGVLMNQMYLNFWTDLNLKPSHLVNIPVYDTIGSFFGDLTTPDFTKIWSFDPAFFSGLGGQYSLLFEMALTIAIVGSLETLLSVEATDKLDPMKRITPPNRELIAQGIGNVVSGLVGGLPITQVIVRSSANVNSGGKTKTSAIFHGILLLLSVIVFPFVLNMIPLACLAGILIMIGYKLANISLFRSMFELGWRQSMPFVITIVAILFTNLLVGIVIGLIISIFYILKDNRSKEPFDVKVERLKTGEFKYKVHITLGEEINYLNKHIVLLSLHDVPCDSMIVLDGTETKFIAQDVLEGIREYQEVVAPSKNIKLDFIEREITQYEINEDVLKGVSV